MAHSGTRQATRPIRVVLTKAGLDAHERGMHVISRGLRDHGFEVIVLGLRQSPRAVVSTAVMEDADVIGVSSLAGGHLTYLRAVMAEMRRQECTAAVVVGGVIPRPDIAALEQLGVAAVFPPGSLVRDIVTKLTELGPARP
ncbi:cobalamin B12-binding domain-containing protein [Actinophytocola sp.]|uniref:cobalamin B12-binding domain-containing protein n=1 Tax=Actinophytocola sp. TaxID=1872138 RepID=UPI003D6A4845